MAALTISYCEVIYHHMNLHVKDQGSREYHEEQA